MTVREEVRERIERDALLAKLRKKIESGNGTYADTAAYSVRAGKLLGEIFSRRLPEIPLEEREPLCVDLLHDQYIDINVAVDMVQRFMDETQGLHLAPQHAPFDAERGHQIGSSLRDLSKPVETLQRRARAATETMTKAMHDNRMKSEAKFRSRAGLKCTVNRIAAAKCCEWCDQVAGKYAYEDTPPDLWRRHDNCNCTIVYGTRRDRQVLRGTEKKWEIVAEGAGAPEPVRLTPEQARKLQEKHQLTVLTKPAESGTITERRGIRISMQFFAHRNSEDMPTIRLPKQEYAHVMSEIASHLTDSDKTSPVFVKRIGNYQYTVENHGFGNYRIIAKRKIRNG